MMEINERLRELRSKLNLSQVVFAQKISVSNGYYAALELGNRKVNDRLIKLICSEFNVNETWLRTGKGSMFVEPSHSLLDEMTEAYHLTELEQKITAAYLSMPMKNREIIMDFIKKIAEAGPSADVLEFAARSGTDLKISETPEQKEKRREETLRDLDSIPDFSFDDDG